MTKQAAVELLQKQLPGFYSTEQVIALIKGIDDFPSLSGSQLEGLVELMEMKIEKKLDGSDSEDFVSFDSAEFELSGNEISLSYVRVDTPGIAELCADVCREVLIDFIPCKEEE